MEWARLQALLNGEEQFSPGENCRNFFRGWEIEWKNFGEEFLEKFQKKSKKWEKFEKFFEKI